MHMEGSAKSNEVPRNEFLICKTLKGRPVVIFGLSTRGQISTCTHSSWEQQRHFAYSHVLCDHQQLFTPFHILLPAFSPHVSNVSLGLILRVTPHHKTWSSEVDEVLLGYTPPSLTFFLSSAVSLSWTFVPHLVKSLVLHTLTEWLNATLQSDLKTLPGSEFAQSHGSLKQPCTSASLPGGSLQQKSTVLMRNLQRREPTLCLSLRPVGRPFQPFCKAFTGPYCGREGELLEDIFQA